MNIYWKKKNRGSVLESWEVNSQCFLKFCCTSVSSSVKQRTRTVPARYGCCEASWCIDVNHRYVCLWIGEGNGNPLQCSCLENPRDGGASWAVVYGVPQSRTRLKWLSSSSMSMKWLHIWKYWEWCLLFTPCPQEAFPTLSTLLEAASWHFFVIHFLIPGSKDLPLSATPFRKLKISNQAPWVCDLCSCVGLNTWLTILKFLIIF